MNISAALLIAQFNMRIGNHCIQETVVNSYLSKPDVDFSGLRALSYHVHLKSYRDHIETLALLKAASKKMDVNRGIDIVKEASKYELAYIQKIEKKVFGALNPKGQ